MTVAQKIACQTIKSTLGITFTGTTEQELEAFIKKWLPRAESTRSIQVQVNALSSDFQNEI